MYLLNIYEKFGLSWWQEIKINENQFRLNSNDIVIKKR